MSENISKKIIHVIINSGFVIFIVTMILLHFLEPEINPIERTMSEYALGRFNWLHFLSMISLSVGSLLLSFSFSRSKYSNEFKIVIVFLCLWSLSMLTATFFPSDSFDPHIDKVVLTTPGIIHSFAGLIGTLSLTLSTIFMKRKIKNHANMAKWESLFRILSIAAVLSVILFILTVSVKPLFKTYTIKSIQGIGERIAMTVFTIWLFSIEKFIRTT